MGEFAIADARHERVVMVARGLGSCVALFIHEPVRRLGGMAHIMLPEPAPRTPLRSPGKFAGTAAAILIDQIQRAGGRRDHMTARVCGGAHLFGATGPTRGETLGSRNVQAALRALEIESIPIVGMDVGGVAGRTIHAEVGTGVVLVRSLSGGLKRL